MHDHQLISLVILLGCLAIINASVYWLVICRTLYRRGAKFPTGFLFWRVFHELRLYEEICRAEGRSLTVYYGIFILSWFNLLLALGTALRALWSQTHGP